MDIAVVVCTYNRNHLLRGALQSLINQRTSGRFCFEVVVVDDGSTDGTAESVFEASENSSVPVRYIRNVGKGQARATNIGIQATSASWIALFDDDQVADEQWLAKLLQMAQATGASCVGSRRVLRFIDAQERNLSRTCRELLGEHVCDAPDGRYPSNLFPQGGSALIARDVFDQVGYFEESLELGGYDTAFFRGARSAGFRDSYAHEAVVYHLIPTYRVGREYFRWASLRMGANFARMDRQFGTLARVALNCIARIAQAMVVNVPLLLTAHVKGDVSEATRRECLLWRAYAYVRQTLQFVMPHLAEQAGFFRTLEFRAERTSALAIRHQ